MEVPKILVVDDVRMFLELQQVYLKKTPARVFTASDGMEALEVARREKPGLVFMDVQMPRMDGIECLRRFKLDFLLRDIPVVMVTTEGKDVSEQCLTAGCADFVTKPIDRERYVAVARKLLPSLDRRDDRVSYQTTAKFKIFGVTLSGILCDLSKRGAFLATEQMLQKGNVLDYLTFPVENHAEPVRVKARVAWANNRQGTAKKGYPMGIGLEFIDTPPITQAIIDRFVEKRLSAAQSAPRIAAGRS